MWGGLIAHNDEKSSQACASHRSRHHLHQVADHTGRRCCLQFWVELNARSHSHSCFKAAEHECHSGSYSQFLFHT